MALISPHLCPVCLRKLFYLINRKAQEQLGSHATRSSVDELERYRRLARQYAALGERTARDWVCERIMLVQEEFFEPDEVFPLLDSAVQAARTDEAAASAIGATSANLPVLTSNSRVMSTRKAVQPLCKSAPTKRQGKPDTSKLASLRRHLRS